MFLLVPAHPGGLGQRAVKRLLQLHLVCVCVCVLAVPLMLTAAKLTRCAM